MAVFSQKRVRIKNYTNGGMVREFPPRDFQIFLMLNYEKRSLEYDFPFTFDHQKKLTELWPFFLQKRKSTPMVAW